MKEITNLSEVQKGHDVYLHALLLLCSESDVLTFRFGDAVLTLADAAIKCLVAAKKGNHDAFNALVILGLIYADHSKWKTGTLTDEDFMGKVFVSIYSGNFKIELPTDLDPNVWGEILGGR